LVRLVSASCDFRKHGSNARLRPRHSLALICQCPACTIGATLRSGYNRPIGIDYEE
jgi:hypothetical protein